MLNLRKEIHKHEPHNEVKITHKVKTKLGERG
jgi:ribosomal protein L31E